MQSEYIDWVHFKLKCRITWDISIHKHCTEKCHNKVQINWLQLGVTFEERIVYMWNKYCWSKFLLFFIEFLQRAD